MKQLSHNLRKPAGAYKKASCLCKTAERVTNNFRPEILATGAVRHRRPNGQRQSPSRQRENSNSKNRPNNHPMGHLHRKTCRGRNIFWPQWQGYYWLRTHNENRARRITRQRGHVIYSTRIKLRKENRFMTHNRDQYCVQEEGSIVANQFWTENKQWARIDATRPNKYSQHVAKRQWWKRTQKWSVVEPTSSKRRVNKQGRKTVKR